MKNLRFSKNPGFEKKITKFKEFLVFQVLYEPWYNVLNLTSTLHQLIGLEGISERKITKNDVEIMENI